MPMPISLFGRAEGGTGKDDSAFSMQERAGEDMAASPSIMPETSTPAPCCANRTEDEPKAAPAVRSKSEPRDTPHHEHTPKGVDIPDTLYRLAALDTNIAALVGWGLVPHLHDGELVIGGMDALDAESRAGLERWLDHPGPNGEPRRERVARALRTGRKAAC